MLLVTNNLICSLIGQTADKTDVLSLNEGRIYVHLSKIAETGVIASFRIRVQSHHLCGGKRSWNVVSKKPSIY